MVQATQSGRGHSGSSSPEAPEAPAERVYDDGAGPASEAEIAALATRLIMQSHGPIVPGSDATELERAVLALAQAARSLRGYPLRNSDEPMTVNGRGPGERA
jgi:hypothetical protein